MAEQDDTTVSAATRRALPTTVLTRAFLRSAAAARSSPAAQGVARSALAHAQATNVLIDPQRVDALQGVFSHELDVDTKASNQHHSGRCWLFAFTNMLRASLIRRYHLPPTFELSTTYLYFWDQLERCQAFLHHVLEHRHEPTDGPYTRYLLAKPVSDGGNWHMLCNIVKKYGVVPKYAMDDTVQTKNTGFLGALLSSKLRQHARTLRTRHRHAPREELVPVLQRMMRGIYAILTTFVGVPPREFQWAYNPKRKEKKGQKKEQKKGQKKEQTKGQTKRAKDRQSARKVRGRARGTSASQRAMTPATKSRARASPRTRRGDGIRATPPASRRRGGAPRAWRRAEGVGGNAAFDRGGGSTLRLKPFRATPHLSPLDFFNQHVRFDTEAHVCVINYPVVRDRPYERLYRVRFIDNVVDGETGAMLNLPMRRLRQLASACIAGGEPVWFAGDMSQDASTRNGVLDPALFQMRRVLGEPRSTLRKGERMLYRDGQPNHAMLLRGYDACPTRKDRPRRWLVENSWGEKSSGDRGSLTMSAAWFDEHVYEIVVPRRLVRHECEKARDRPTIVLEPWDAFGTLL